MAETDPHKTRIQIALGEYGSMRRLEVAAFQSGTITLVITFVVQVSLLTLGIIFDQPLLYFIGPAASMFGVYLTGAADALILLTAVRISEIEESVNKQLGEDIFGFELRGGVFANVHENVIVKNLWSYLRKAFIGASVVFISIHIFSLFLGLSWLYRASPSLAIVVATIFAVGSIVEGYWGYSVNLLRKWEHVSLEK